MSTTTPSAVAQICGEIDTISENQFADAIAHYELECGLTADEAVEMTTDELTLQTTFTVRGDEPVEEVPSSRVAVGWHLFSHPLFLSGSGWAKYDQTTVCPECVVPVTVEGKDCPHCGGTVRAAPSLPDTIVVQQSIDITETVESVDDIENVLTDIFGTTVSIQ